MAAFDRSAFYVAEDLPVQLGSEVVAANVDLDSDCERCFRTAEAEPGF
jgi:hypothetical protein